MARRSAARVLADALAREAIGGQRFAELAAAAARGEDISWVDALTGRRGPAPEPAAIGMAAPSARRPGELGNDEADRLWPPRNEAEARHRFRAAEVAAARVRELPDDALYEQLFAAAPGHEEFTGAHMHEHPAYQQGDNGPAEHSHVHEHFGDANHDHHQ